MGEKGIPVLMCGYAKNHGPGTYRVLNPKTNKIRITRDVNWGNFRSRQLDEDMEELFEPGVESDKEENDTSKTTETTTDETSGDEEQQQEPPTNKKNRKGRKRKKKKKASVESDDTSSIEYINVREIWNKEVQRQEEDSTTSEDDVSTLNSGGISKSTISKPLMRRSGRNKEQRVTMKRTSPLRATRNNTGMRMRSGRMKTNIEIKKPTYNKRKEDAVSIRREEEESEDDSSREENESEGSTSKEEEENEKAMAIEERTKGERIKIVTGDTIPRKITIKEKILQDEEERSDWRVGPGRRLRRGLRRRVRRRRRLDGRRAL